ncbi:MAG: metal-dependent hydrolase [Lachnospiraceae bacterium]|nr:metal-dependent hydrolase [Lachnospiraceae bacterium]MBQ4069651.1 amidohydrolase family protein [Lachnospiraceae bacterium]
MIIDFHTHIFPDRVAEKAIPQMEKNADIKAHHNGTLSGLLESMNYANIDYSVVLPVVTAPRQFESVNKFAYEVNNLDRIISFGGIHPDTENYKKEIDTIKNYGLKGIKLHPEYQSTYINDDKYLRIMDYATELGLIITVHAGFDGAYPQEKHCTPKRIAEALRYVSPDKLVLAHMGSLYMWDEVEEYIVGKNVFLDTAFSIGEIEDEQLLRMVRNHGADKVLFSTDSPWKNQKEAVSHISKIPFTEEELDKILYKNAIDLLGGDI